jgi:hypothetical protein
MRVQAFIDWLRDEGYPQNQIDSHVNRCGRVELAETVDLDNFREKGVRNELLGRFSYSVEDERHARPQRHHVVIDGNVLDGTRSLRSAIKLYWRFIDGLHRPGQKKEADNVVVRESYSEFLQTFQIGEDAFVEYGINHSIFATDEQALDKTEELIRALKKENDKPITITIRKDRGRHANLWLELYRYLFDNDHVQFDGDGNKVPRDTLAAATLSPPSGHGGNTILHNYILSHVFDVRTMNPLLFGNTCNFAFTPTIFDPLTGMARGGIAMHFRERFRMRAYETFQKSYEKINAFINTYIVEKTGLGILESIRKFKPEVPTDELQDFIVRALQQWSPIPVPSCWKET